MALGETQGMPLGLPQGTVAGGNPDWSLWWGTIQGTPGARLHVWRCSATGLNVGQALVVMTVEDARRIRMDDQPTAFVYLSGRYGSGRYRLTPRTDQGTKLPGTQSLVVSIDEDMSMQVSMHHPALSPTPALMPGVDRETAIEIEQMRLQAELERERETRRERQRDVREERRRERDV